MKPPHYTVSIDRGSGAISFPDLGYAITDQSREADIMAGLAPLRPKCVTGENEEVHVRLGVGTFLDLPCSCAPVVRRGVLGYFLMVIPESVTAVGLQLHQHLGFRLHGPEEKFPWGSLYFDLSANNNVVIIHIFETNKRKPRARKAKRGA